MTSRAAVGHWSPAAVEGGSSVWLRDLAATAPVFIHHGRGAPLRCNLPRRLRRVFPEGDDRELLGEVRPLVERALLYSLMTWTTGGNKRAKWRGAQREHPVDRRTSYQGRMKGRCSRTSMSRR